MNDLHHILSLFLVCKRAHHLERYIHFLSLKKYTLVEKMPLELYLLFLSSSILYYFETLNVPSHMHSVRDGELSENFSDWWSRSLFTFHLSLPLSLAILQILQQHRRLILVNLKVSLRTVSL